MKNPTVLTCQVLFARTLLHLLPKASKVNQGFNTLITQLIAVLQFAARYWAKIKFEFVIMDKSLVGIHIPNKKKSKLEPVCCKKRQKIVPDQLLVWGIRAL